MYSAIGFDNTGRDETFSFTNSGSATDLTGFTGAAADGGAKVRQAISISNCSGDGSDVYVVVRTASLPAPTISPTDFMYRIVDGDDRIIHARKGARVWAITSSAGIARVRSVELG